MSSAPQTLTQQYHVPIGAPGFVFVVAPLAEPASQLISPALLPVARSLMQWHRLRHQRHAHFPSLLMHPSLQDDDTGSLVFEATDQYYTNKLPDGLKMHLVW